MKHLLYGLALLALLAACTTENDNKATVSFALTDAPSQKGYLALNVTVEGIEYSVDSGEFVTLPMQSVTVNLMDFTNGTDTLLGNVELEAGERITQVRLMLGEDNTLILADSSIVNIKTPSAQQSGLKINIQSAAEVSSGYKVLIDFDAEKSVVAKGNGTYSLKPVIRGYITANTSKVFGNIIPANAPYLVRAIKGTDTILTISDTLQHNYFMLHGLVTGTYSLEFVDADNAIAKTLSQEVHGGTTINLDTVRIVQ